MKLNHKVRLGIAFIGGVAVLGAAVIGVMFAKKPDPSQTQTGGETQTAQSATAGNVDGDNNQQNFNNSTVNQYKGENLKTLPDGRVVVGNIATGEPVIFQRHLGEAGASFAKGLYEGCFDHAEQAIKIVEAEPDDLRKAGVSVQMGSNNQFNLKVAYAFASACGRKLGYTNKANAYIDKGAVDSPENKSEYAYILFQVGLVDDALRIVNEVLALEPENQVALRVKEKMTQVS